jgi:hypothetical protein
MKAAAGAGCPVYFKASGSSYQTSVEIARGGSMLIRARTPLRVKLGGGESLAGIGLKLRKVSAAVAAITKLLKKGRLKYKIPLEERAGYICFLAGINDLAVAARLRREAALERSLRLFGLDDLSISSAHELFDEPLKCLPAMQARPSCPPRGKIAIILHLYYPDLWAEIAAFLSQVPPPFGLWITHCGMESAIRDRILQLFPEAVIQEVENRGRDIWPFVSLLNEGVFGGYDYICKIHSKKSAHSAGVEESLLGSRWRRRALYDLLAAGRAPLIAEMFDSNPRLGIVGPAALRIPSAHYTAEMAWGSVKNWERTRQLARRMGVEVRAGDIDFFAGSMFWGAPAALEPLRQLKLNREDFPEEKGQLDGELQHAIERAFTISTLRAGLGIAVVGPMAVESLNSDSAGIGEIL